MKNGPDKTNSKFNFNDLTILLEESNLRLSRDDYKKLTSVGK